MESVRAAERDDCARLAELARLARAGMMAQRGGALLAAGTSLQEPLDAAFGAQLDDETAAVFVGCIDEYPVGYAVVRVALLDDTTAVARCDEIYVEPDARAVGVGEELAGAVLRFAADHDCQGVDALALPGDRTTKNFFEGQGFTARLLTMHRPLPDGA